MKSLGRPSPESGPSRLLNLFTTKFAGAQQAHDLFDEFLQHTTYSRSLCLRLLAVAKHRVTADWDVRRLAVLMLEHTLLKLDPDNLDEFDVLFTQLNLKQALGLNEPMVGSVRKEGYSTTRLSDFIPEFLRRLGRMNHLHAKIRGRQTPTSAAIDFIEASGRDCKLTLARYLFTPDEVVDEILRLVQVSGGVKDLDTSQPSLVDKEMTRALNFLPDYEGRILQRLCETCNIYWVSDTTSSEINSLVEYPLTTVVLTIKPPGSDIEFEIKRAGRKGNPLNVVFARAGCAVPPSHRLDGGNMLWLLQYEAIAGSKLGGIYRLVQGTEAPIAYYVSRSTIYSVPVRDTDVQTIPYFTEPHLFGSGFREMRTAMQASVKAFRAEGNELLPDLPGELGLTAQFVGHVAPAQAILCGTTSYRLDKLATYLSSSGPETYFKAGLAVAFGKRDEKRFADELLQEVLGTYCAPKGRYQTYEEYLEAAFTIPENRARADQTYLSLVQQIAAFWGTLLGLRGYTKGESFVGRNVGLKSFWDKGQWKVRIIFMDHDAVVISGPGDGHFYPHGALPHMTTDERYIWGRSNARRFATSDVGYLQSIYRIGTDLDAEGQARAQVAMKGAYDKTQHELLTNSRLGSLFSEVFIERLLDWDSLVRGYLQMKRNKTSGTAWKNEMKKMLAAKGYGRGAFESYFEVMEKHRDFLQRTSFLFECASAKVATPNRT